MCSFDAVYTANIMMLGENVVNLRTDPARINTLIQWNGERWTAPQIRKAMEEGLQKSAIAAPVSRGSSGPSALCKSLTAGVSAAGGNSTSTALNPQTWGC
jgi:hypothetical protein